MLPDDAPSIDAMPPLKALEPRRGGGLCHAKGRGKKPATRHPRGSKSERTALAWAADKAARAQLPRMMPWEFREFRLERLGGMGQKLLAQKLGVTWRSVYMWERGERPISFLTQLALERVEQQLIGEREVQSIEANAQVMLWMMLWAMLVGKKNPGG